MKTAVLRERRGRFFVRGGFSNQDARRAERDVAPTHDPNTGVCFMSTLHKLIADEMGQDLTEYGLLAAFLSIAAVVTVRTIGPLIVPLYERVHAVL